MRSILHATSELATQRPLHHHTAVFEHISHMKRPLTRILEIEGARVGMCPDARGPRAPFERFWLHDRDSAPEQWFANYVMTYPERGVRQIIEVQVWR